MARKTSTPSTTTTKPAATKPERVEFQPLLLAALKDAGVKVKVRQAPKGNYSSLLVADENVAYVDKQTAKGMKVIAAAKPAVAKNGFKDSGRSGRFASQLVVTKEAEVAKAAAGIKLAAEALASAKAEKADEAAAKKTAAKAAKAEKVTAEEIDAASSVAAAAVDEAIAELETADANA